MNGVADHYYEEDLGNGREFVAACPAMRRMREQIEQVAAIDVPMLFLGESGVGKEVAARMAHRLSPRRFKTFFKVNCAALPADLLESELFGYMPGAFTGATHAKPGKFEMCEGGTIFLDEIGELPPALQAKLLQVLEDRQFSRLGGRNVISVNVRIIAATNLNMREALAARRFREDLYYRLSAVTIDIPPLRERSMEIAPMLDYFRRRLAVQLGRPPVEIPPELIAACERYHWPGNVRELQNFVKRLLILGTAEGLSASLGEAPAGPGPSNVIEFPDPANGDLKSMVRQLKSRAETRAIEAALARTNWNRAMAAQALGISAKALMHKMQQYGIRHGATYAATSEAEPETYRGAVKYHHAV